MKKLLACILTAVCAMGIFSACDQTNSDAQVGATQTVTETTAETTIPETTEPTAVTMHTAALSLAAGGTSFLNVTVKPLDLYNAVQWTSSDETVVVVDSAGRIDGVAPGTATVTASVSHVTASAEITVTEEETPTQPETNYTSGAYIANQVVLNENLDKIDREETTNLPYSIKVNRELNCVTVYTFDENGDYTVPVRAMTCSSGKDNGTILGKFTIYCKYRWLGLYGDVDGQYISGFSGDFLFHSVPYERKDAGTLKTDQYNLLGESASLGCIRLATGDAKWIYDNCDNGTPVEIFDDSTTPGPLGKPESIQIPETITWDPTDDNEENPYFKKMPEILGAADITIPLNSEFVLENGVTATDTCGNDITDKITVLGLLKTEKAGTYRITYMVTDSLNRTAKTERYITVK